jgi:hypothetical protein
VQKKARLLTSAEYHQMAGRAGRPQFDTEGIALVLAPETVVQDIKKELKDAQKSRLSVDEAKIRKSAYARAKSEAQRNQDVTWDKDDHDKIIHGKPAALKSQTKISAEQILAIGLPDLAREALPGAAIVEAEAQKAAVAAAASDSSGNVPSVKAADTGKVTIPIPTPLDESSEPLPASMNLNIVTVIQNLLLDERDKYAAHKRLAQVTANLRAMGIIDEHGEQVSGQVINQLRGIDGLFVYHCLMSRDLDYALARELVEFLVDHDIVQRILDRKGEDKKREWIKNRLRERRRDEPQVSWEDVEAEYDQKFPRELTPVEQLHAEFLGRVPHPELHGGKKRKNVFAQMQDGEHSFLDFVEKENLETEEGSLFSYLVRVMKFAKMLFDATALDEFRNLEDAVRDKLSVIDARVVEEVLGERKLSVKPEPAEVAEEKLIDAGLIDAPEAEVSASD